jgi:hypothetical protein
VRRQLYYPVNIQSTAEEEDFEVNALRHKVIGPDRLKIVSGNDVDVFSRVFDFSASPELLW